MPGINLNLLDQLAFYGAYHANRWNQLIHFVGVPTIVWTVAVWLAYSGALIPGSLYTPWLDIIPENDMNLKRFLHPNGALALILAYAVFYVCLDIVAGLTWAACMGLPIWISATAFCSLVPSAWSWAIPIQLLSWYLQIHPGHMILEKRRPALLDNLVQAFLLAPLFVWFELLFLLGYRPKLQRELKNRVGKDIAAWKRSKKAQH